MFAARPLRRLHSVFHPLLARALFMRSYHVFISSFSSDQLQGEYFSVIANCDIGHGDRLVVLGSRMEVNDMLSNEYSGGYVITSPF